MIYIALLRGINVGGNSKVDMKQLKACFEKLGLENVKTYINSGNVIFSDTKHTQSKLIQMLETAIEKEFGFAVYVLVITKKQLETIAKALPANWSNDQAMKSDVMFLWSEVDTPEIIKDLIIKPEFDKVMYVPGALLWGVDRQHLTRSGLLRLAGTPLYKKMTIRNCNTVRKLVTLVNADS